MEKRKRRSKDEERISTPDLQVLLDRGEARVGRYLSDKSREARVELIAGDSRSRTVIVRDPSA